MAKAMLIMDEMPTSCDVCEYVDNSHPNFVNSLFLVSIQEAADAGKF